ncbi:MAG: rhomboid family intramembrane serine protease [Candidatus Thiodiazotropha sp.]|jgi:rhomboid protease GluP
MIVFIASIIAYIGLLFFIKPAPSNLKSIPITYRENFKFVWASMLSGSFILLVFLLTTNFDFVTVDETVYSTLALSNNSEQILMWPLQSITHLFIHNNLIHLVANVAGLGLASAYERRVGAKRFFTVLFVSSLVSALSIIFYSENITVCGISGGVFGLGAAYFTDEKELTTKEWLAAIMLFLLFASMLALDAEFKEHSSELLGMKVDHVGHLLGALGAIIYCRLRPLSNLLIRP